MTSPLRLPLPPLRVAALLALLAAPRGWAQDPALQAAIARYESAEFQQAIDQLAALADDPATAHADRIAALEYLGRACIAEHRLDQARSALDRLLALEPPLIELDPEREHPDLMNLYYEARLDLQGSYAIERDSAADPGLQTLAIMDFTNSSVDRHDDFDPLRQGFASMMINYLRGATGLQVIERERIQWLLGELEIQRDAGLVDQRSAVEAGRLLGAQAVLFGAFTAAGDRMWMSTRLVKVETGEVLLAEQVFGTPDAFFDLVEQLSVQVAQAINANLDSGVELDEEGLGERRDTGSLDAMLAYSRGIALVQEGDLAGAEAQFQAALDADPGYARARQRLDALHPFVAAAR